MLLGISRYVNLRPTWSAELVQFSSNQDIKQYVKESPPDALLAFTASKETDDLLDKLELPVIISPSLHRPRDGRIVQILVDDEATGRLGAEFFLDLGFEHLGFCGFSEVFWSKQRSESFCRQCEQAGYKAHVHEKTILGKDTPTKENPQYYLTNNWKNLGSLYQPGDPLSRWLHDIPKPIGIMCCNDYFARKVLLSCRQQGLNVPEEVALLGVDNDQLMCEFINPSLSSVELDWEKNGFNTAALLDKLMKGETTEKQTIYVRPLQVAERKTTDILAFENDYVCEAIRFIRAKSSQPVTVEDVVVHMGCSRRYLELEFKKVRSCTIRDEIQRTRANWVGKMLLGTDMSVFQIALQGNFSSHSHMTRLFVRLKDMTPEQYRKQFS